MHDNLTVPVASLLVDELNPRLAQPSSGQREAIRALSKVQGRKLQFLAKHILDNGLNPSDLIIVTPFGGEASRYVVLDGNRRLTALRVLENPDLLAEAVAPSLHNAIRKLALKYRESPITEIPCVVFDKREEANHWIELRNAGESGGAGPVQWGSDETDIFRTRTGGRPNLATQVLDFLEGRGDISADQRQNTAATTLTRILGSPDIRPRLGLEQSNGSLLAVGDLDDVAKALAYVVTEISERRLDVTHVYTKQQRTEFADHLPAEIIVNRVADPGNGTPINISEVKRGDGEQNSTPPIDKPRNRLIPDDCALNVTDPRTHDIERELRALSLSRNPNAVAVLFRVFIEMSVDSYIAKESIGTPSQANLRARLTAASDHLIQRQKLTKSQAAPVKRAATRDSFLGPSVPLMHNWVHNQHMSPVPNDLRSHWNDLQSFISAIWAP